MSPWSSSNGTNCADPISVVSVLPFSPDRTVEQPNEKRIGVARSRDTNPGLDEIRARALRLGFLARLRGHTGAVSRRVDDHRGPVGAVGVEVSGDVDVLRCRGRPGAGDRRHDAAHGRSACGDRGSGRRQHGVLMAAGSTTVGGRR